MKLVKRLLPSSEHDALLGDIAEEARHRSRLWYWGQLAAVVLVASWKDVRAHRWLAFKATITGLLTLGVFFSPANLAIWTIRVLSEGGYYVGPLWLTLPHSALLVAPFFFNTTGFVLSGWIVARFHRAHGFAMVLPYLCLVCILPALAIARLLMQVAEMHDVRWLAAAPLYVSALLATVTLPLCVVAGAMLGARRI